MNVRTMWACLAVSSWIALASAWAAGGGPVRVILETDMSGDCDDAGALALLHALADAGECELLATIVNRKDKTGASAAATDAINTFYGRPDLPIGTDKTGPTDLQRTSAYAPALRDGFPNDMGPDDRAPDALDVYRRVLAAQPDGSVTVCSVGALSNLAELWRREPALVRAKIRQLVVMGGAFPGGKAPETNIRTHVAAARLVAAEWPGPIVWHGFEVGHALITGAALKGVPTNHPVRRAYELKPYGRRPAIDGGQPSWDQGAALYAVRGPQPEFWSVVAGGRVAIDEEGVTTWTPDPAGAHAWVKIAGDPAKLAATIEELMVRPPRAAAAKSGGAATPAGGLNVLFLMTDEQHHRSLSLTGNRHVTTPNMDRIGREGALFVDATCVTPYCSPSRASFLTGVYPHRHGILVNVDGKSAQPALRQDAFPNTETILHGRGWATAHFGKWHLGDPGDFDCYERRVYAGRRSRDYPEFLDAKLPAAQFAGFAGPGRYLGRPVEMIPAVEKGYREFAAGPDNRLAYIGIIGRSVIPPELLPETRITDDAIRAIEQNASRRFMITVSWSPPHDLWVIPEPYYSMVDRATIELPGGRELPEWDAQGASARLGRLVGDAGLREYAAIYHGMVKYIDDQVGRILAKLDELGLADRTLVIFTSDHGDMVGAHGCIGKSVQGFYDDLVRIPFLMRLPGVIPAGSVVRRPVSQVDLMPTILDYAGQPAPEGTHGRSLRPLVDGRDVPWRDYAFSQRANRLRMIRTERFKYVFGLKPRVTALYDLRADPQEDRNLAGAPEHAAEVRRMHRRLLEVMEADGDPVRKQFPDDPLAP